MKKLIIAGMVSLLLTINLYAQTPEDALRYSRINFNGTSRFTGMSGAFGAVGADFSTLATNPAGLGLYKGSEMTLTFAPNLAYSSSDYNGFIRNDTRGNFGLGNFGLVFSANTANQPNTGILKNINFGIGFNRQNDFSNRIRIHGENLSNSLMQSYANILNQQRLAPELVEYDYPFDIGLAYAANLVYHDSATNRYYADAAFGGVLQDKLITTSGAINELDISAAVNLDEKLFIGLTLGIPTVNYYEKYTYQEKRSRDTVPNFVSLLYRYDLHTRGTGINLKLGALYRPLDWLRAGVSIHTPTWYPSMSDSWSSYIESRFDSSYWNNSVYSPLGYYDYRMTTPFRAMGSLAFIISQYGLVSADYEYVNYAHARFNSAEDSYTAVNDEIRSSFGSYGNFRFGTEWRIDRFRIRGGMAYYSNPYRNKDYNGEKLQFSGGIGYRSKHFFIDMAYIFTRMNQQYYLYDAAMVNPAQIANYSHSLTATAGIRF